MRRHAQTQHPLQPRHPAGRPRGSEGESRHALLDEWQNLQGAVQAVPAAFGRGRRGHYVDLRDFAVVISNSGRLAGGAKVAGQSRALLIRTSCYELGGGG